MDAGEEPERGAAQVDWCCTSDGGVFGGLHEADADAGGHEPWEQTDPCAGVTGEPCVGQRERGDAEDEGEARRALI